jgi:hypothetical protein
LTDPKIPDLLIDSDDPKSDDNLDTEDGSGESVFSGEAVVGAAGVELDGSVSG